jgi:Dolichyl-phosphate-mannose-protein mannosyltransferase
MAEMVSRPSTWVLLGTALVMRLIIFSIVITSYNRDWLYSRGLEMGLVANSLLHGMGYSSPFGGATGPTAFIAPGYPTLVAGVFLLFGTYSFGSAIAIMLVQILLSLLTIWLMMQIARETVGMRTANIAAAFWAVSLPLLWIPTIFWETSISACVFPATIAFALHLRRNPTFVGWIFFGSCCALAGLINPALLPSLLAIFLWMAWQTRTISLKAPTLGLLAMIVVFSPWPIRNARVFHAFIPTRTTVGFELWMGNRPGSTGFLNESIFPMYNKQELASYLSMGEIAYTNQKTALAWQYIRDRPGTFVALSVRRFFRFWSGTGTEHGSRFYEAHALLTTILGFTGLAMLYRRGMRGFATLMALPLLLFPLPYYITHAEFRYRLNIDPVLTILAAYALVQLAGGMVVNEDADAGAPGGQSAPTQPVV